jgi:hypothetical protein
MLPDVGSTILDVKYNVDAGSANCCLIDPVNDHPVTLIGVTPSSAYN